MSRFDLGPATRWGINSLALLGVVVALKWGKPLFLPIVISMMLAVVIRPLVLYFQDSWYLPRVLAGMAAISLLLLACFLGVLWAALAVQALVEELPHTSDQQEAAYEKLRSRFADINEQLAESLFPPKAEDSVVFKNTNQFLRDLEDKAPGHVRTFIEQTVLILFLVLFLSIEGDMLIRRTAEIFGPSTGPGSKAALLALKDMARQVRNYLVWRTVINLGMALFLWAIYWQLGLRQAWTWAILAGILTYVPYIGPIIAGIPPILDAFVTVGPGTALVVFIIYVLILTAEGYLVFPLVLGRHMEMNATTVMLACLFWYVVWDEVGLFLALPLMAGIKAICEHVPGWRPWANLMGMELHDIRRAGWLRRSLRWLVGATPPAAVQGDGALADGKLPEDVDGNEAPSPHAEAKSEPKSDST